MKNLSDKQGSRANEELEREVAARTARKMRARREKDRAVWFGFGMFGLIGWSVAIPTVIGASLGIWIDARWPGQHSWTLMLLVLGVALGCVNAWSWVQKETHHTNKRHQEEQE